MAFLWITSVAMAGSSRRRRRIGPGRAGCVTVRHRRGSNRPLRLGAKSPNRHRPHGPAAVVKPAPLLLPWLTPSRIRLYRANPDSPSPSRHQNPPGRGPLQQHLCRPRAVASICCTPGPSSHCRSLLCNLAIPTITGTCTTFTSASHFTCPAPYPC